jgi:hypothetical protein
VAVRGKVSPTSPFRIASERDSSNVICGATLIVSSDSPWPSPEGEGDSPIATEKLALGATAMVTTALSAGYVTWLLRSGSLVASLLAVLPAWQSVDPLPILESFEESRRQDDGGEDLQSIVG